MRWPFPGLSIAGFSNSSNAGIVFSTLKPFEERKSPQLSAGAIAMSLNQKYGVIQDAFIAMFPPPPVQGLGVSAASSCRSRIAPDAVMRP